MSKGSAWRPVDRTKWDKAEYWDNLELRSKKKDKWRKNGRKDKDQRSS